MQGMDTVALSFMNVDRVREWSATPVPKPVVRFSDRVEVRRDFGSSARPLEAGAESFADEYPFNSWDGRVTSVDDIRELLLTYRMLLDTYAKRTPSAQRLALLDDARPAGNGSLHVTLVGVMADYAKGPRDGRVSRICLCAPSTVAEPGAPWRRVDSHLWLLARDMRQPRPDARRLLVGESVVVDAEVRAYTDRHGNRRLGVGAWTPTHAVLPYYQCYRDGRVRYRNADVSRTVDYELVHMDGSRPRVA